VRCAARILGSSHEESRGKRISGHQPNFKEIILALKLCGIPDISFVDTDAGNARRSDRANDSVTIRIALERDTLNTNEKRAHSRDANPEPVDARFFKSLYPLFYPPIEKSRYYLGEREITRISRFT
jgi:hypothetical protein